MTVPAGTPLARSTTAHRPNRASAAKWASPRSMRSTASTRSSGRGRKPPQNLGPAVEVNESVHLLHPPRTDDETVGRNQSRVIAAFAHTAILRHECGGEVRLPGVRSAFPFCGGAGAAGSRERRTGRELADERPGYWVGSCAPTVLAPGARQRQYSQSSRAPATRSSAIRSHGDASTIARAKRDASR
jgi:hypothetical protein